MTDSIINEEIRTLYQELIIDHGTRPKNFRKQENPSVEAEGYNPLCGDKIELFLQIDEDKIKEATFQGQGCAISTASASLMTEILIGKTIEEAMQLFQNFQILMTNSEPFTPELGKLVALKGVRAFPMRVKCATLAWHTLHAALKKIQKGIKNFPSFLPNKGCKYYVRE